MGLFDFLKGNKKEEKTNFTLHSTSNGEVVALEKVDDPVFSQKMMGDGYAIEPEDGEIYSSVTGTIKSVFPTKHALGIELENGQELLLHIGIDTVELEGEPFTNHVKEGEKVTPQTLLTTVDLKALDAADKGKTIMVVFPEAESVENITIEKKGHVAGGEEIGTIAFK